jgi:hypothetical protein
LTRSNSASFGCAADGLHCGVELGLAAAGDVDVGAFAGETFCDGQADAGAAAGDDCYFFCEFHAVFP